MEIPSINIKKPRIFLPSFAVAINLPFRRIDACLDSKPKSMSGTFAPILKTNITVAA